MFDLARHLAAREPLQDPLLAMAHTAPRIEELKAEAARRVQEIRELEADYAEARLMARLARVEAIEAGCFE